MDLTRSFPRSPSETIHGVTMAARTADKARAAAAGTLGEYHYDCPMDKRLFAFLGTAAPTFQAAATSAADDSGAARLVEAQLAGKSPSEIDAFNAGLLGHAPPPGSEGAEWLRQTVASIAPDRGDITTFADMIDLEEGRDVPRRAAATA